MLAIISARMSSHRLPGKALLELGGQTVLSRVVARVLSAKSVSKLVVATSIDASDDEIEKASNKAGVKCYRGSLEDVAGRFVGVLRKEEASEFIRVTGDSPLIDPSLIDTAVSLFKASECDLVSNVFPRTFPKGQSVEIIRSSSFLEAYTKLDSKEHREHASQFFYKNCNEYRIVTFSSGGSFQDHQLSIDTETDLIDIRELIHMLDVPNPGWRDYVERLLEIKEGNNSRGVR